METIRDLNSDMMLLGLTDENELWGHHVLEFHHVLDLQKKSSKSKGGMENKAINAGSFP